MPKGYAAGELKHGPIALDRPCRSTSSRPTTATSRAQKRLRRAADDAHPADGAGNGGAARLCRAGAAHRLVIMGTDVDQPRNLAKSVTVE